MSTDYSFEMKLQALGRILDRRPRGRKDLCILDTGGGFVVNMLEAGASQSGSALTPTTVVIEPDELQQTLAELLQPPPHEDEKAGGRRWFGRG